jgi:1-phosphatidylinositol-4-phosphate 5-kinase
LPDGSYYEGYFMDGFMHGKGRFIFAKGDYYIGDFVKGKAIGHGVYYNP